MQPWSGGRRERSSSVVLLGKLSAIVRRGSIFQVDPEDERDSSSSNSSEGDKEHEDETGARKARHARRSSIGATPTTQSAMTMWDPKNSHSNGSSANQRFQFYPARPLVAAALARPLSQEELMRRATLEAQIEDFGGMHANFAPILLLEEKETEDEMDNNEQETLEEERRAAFEEDEEKGSFEDDEELDFDPKNMPTSVRRLMNRIQSDIMLSESDVPIDSATVDLDNQDEDEDDDDYDEDDIDEVEDVDDLDLDNNSSDQDEERSSSEQDEAPMCQELVHELSPAEHRLLQRRRTHLLSCAAEQAALSAQDQLTSSVRRLVIQLKEDSDQMHKPLAQSHGIRRKPRSPPMRKRAGSCPSGYDLGIASPVDGSPMPTSPALAAQDMHPGKKHKKSAFSRIGPRVLETLHLRKKRKTYLFTDEELETIEGARWKIVELAFRFGGKHRSYLVQAINMFFPLLKYGRRGGAHATRLHCNCCGTVQWQHKRGGLSEAVDLAEVLQVLDGRQTAVFRKYDSNSVLEACSFSVVFPDRTLDLETQSSSHRDWLVSALRTLVAYARRQRRIEQQAIAERAILPMDDDPMPMPSPSAQLSSPLAAQPTDDIIALAAMSPSYKIRTVY
ncbi:hypothetical protein PHMEG_0004847 [Phytophthora megakarya]|uniref:Uncharacterized protein n=1 Tax=Phytophthora megakarya TaxID=4795 RepID=A0A225WSW7_9STRA|nr:hypothetical protein PHMEG_0004847 [Phytophthora megakarya]